MQCRECEGYVHIQYECATYLNQKRSMKASKWSDDEEEDED